MNRNVLSAYPAHNLTQLNHFYQEVMNPFHHKIVALDDDPTGIQKALGLGKS